MGLCLSGNEARFFAQPPLQYWRLTRRVSFTRKPVDAFDWGGLCSVQRVCDVRRHHRPPLRRVASRGSVIVDRYSCKGQAAEAKQGVPGPACMLAAITESPLLPWRRSGPSPLWPSVSVARRSGCRVPCVQPTPMRASQPRVCYFFSRLAERVLAGLAGSLSN